MGFRNSVLKIPRVLVTFERKKVTIFELCGNGMVVLFRFSPRPICVVLQGDQKDEDDLEEGCR